MAETNKQLTYCQDANMQLEDPGVHELGLKKQPFVTLQSAVVGLLQQRSKILWRKNWKCNFRPQRHVAYNNHGDVELDQDQKIGSYLGEGVGVSPPLGDALQQWK